MSEIKPVKLFPTLYDIKPFLIRNHPELHPDSLSYKEYWEEQEKRCLEGLWGLDVKGSEGGWRYMPGNLYYYANFCIIKDEDEESNTTKTITPLLRDMEWMFAYGWLTTIGFSGFEDDSEYTCNEIVKKIERGDDLSPKEKVRLSKLKHIRKEDGSYKTYIEAREYLYKTHAQPLGKPIYGNSAKNFFVLTSRRSGKDLEENTLLHTENGKIPIKDINIGDKIYGADGKLTTVVSKTLFNDQLQYEFKLVDGRSLECGAGHLWTVYDSKYKKNITVSTETLIKEGLTMYAKGDNRFFIQYNKPIEYKKSNLSIDPYFLGLWLGDGTKHRTGIATADSEIVEYIYKYAKELNLKVSINKNKYKTCPTYFISAGAGNHVKPRILRDKFISLNLINNKHIPEEYLQASIEDRMDLLRGLMDSDGHVGKNSTISFSNTDKKIVDGVEELLGSLGIRYKTKSRITHYKHNGVRKAGKKSYRIHIITSKSIFKLPRKLNRINNNPSKFAITNRSKVAIESITPTAVKPSVCIGVDNEDKLFVAGDYIVTHNSYFTANAIIGHAYNFYGKKFFDENYIAKPDGIEIVVGAALSAKSADLLKKFLDTQEHLKKNYGAWGEHDEFIPGYFFNNSTGKIAPGNSDSPYRHEYKYQQGGVWMTGGTGTKIIHVSYADNPEAAVGTGPQVLVVEEVGLMTKLLQTHASNETTMIRRNKFGSAVYIGTGGNMEKIVESKIVFEDPLSYDFLPYPDLWERRSKPIGFFIPAYYTDNTFKDENGNTNLEAALEQELLQRETKEQADNTMALDGYMMARPLVPSEMFLTDSVNVFPTAKLRERLARVETEDIFKTWASIGELNYTSSRKDEVIWSEDIFRKNKPITTMNLDSYQGNYNSSIVIYEHPPADIPNPTYWKSLYKVVYDPIKDDGEGTSLASILVYKGYSKDNWNQGTSDDIVAEYIGRHNRVNDIHEIAIKMALYFNAKILVENNIPDFIRYCKMEGRYNILQLSPHEAISKVIKNPGRKYEVGVTMSKGLNIHSEQLLRQWLLEPLEMKDGKPKFTLNKLKSPRLLQELISYDRERNFDHISSMKLLVLWLSQEREKVVEQYEQEDTNRSMDELYRSSLRPHRIRKKLFHAY